MGRVADEELGREAARLLSLAAAEIARRTGLRPRRWELLRRGQERARAQGLALEEYLRRLPAQPAEFLELVEALRVGETRFYRHPALFAELATEVLPAALKRCAVERRPLRAWSAGCATGEESWTLAMLLAEAAPEQGEPPEVLGTDLSAPALRVAEAGRYLPAAARQLPRALQARYLVTRRGDGGEWVEVAALLRERVLVTFQVHNLFGPQLPEGFDLILCCNVLIYFDAADRCELLLRLHRSLRPGGRLLLGPADAPRLSLPPRQEGGPPRRSRSSRPAPAAPTVLRLSGGYGDGERLARELRPHLAAGRDLLIDLDGADYLGSGDAQVLRRALAAGAVELRAERPGVIRWLQRERLAGEAP